MTDVLEIVRSRGATLTVAGERLRIEAPPGAITHDLLEALRAAKADIVARLQAEAVLRLPPGSPVTVRRVDDAGTVTWERTGVLSSVRWDPSCERHEAEIVYPEAPAFRFVYTLAPGATRWKAPAWGEAVLVPVEEVERHVEPGADGAA